MSDFEALFRFSVNPLELVLRGALIYVGLVLLFRFALRRDLGQLGVADVLFIVLIADASQNGMAGEYRSLADAAVLIGTLAACNVALDWATYHWPAMQRLMEVPTVELVRNGRILRRNLRREWMTVDELMGKLREQGIANVADVKLAVMEANGELSVLKSSGGARPTDPAKHARQREAHRQGRVETGQARGVEDAVPDQPGRREARRTSMQSQLAELGLAYETIGVDFRRARRADIDAWIAQRFSGISFDHRNLSGAEIGCWASHLCAWQALASSAVAACTVLEDDLQLDPGLPEAIDALAGKPSLDLVFLGTSSRNVSARRRLPAGRFQLHTALGTIYNTWGYVVSRVWVRRFFAAAPWRVDRPIDHYTGGSRAGSVRPRIAVMRPAVVSEDPELGVDSQIEPFTYRIDRARIVESTRRRIIASRVSALYYKLYEYF